MKNYRFLYGPVPSRRLGRSLGVDLIPYKYCTFDCIYCQLGKTTNKTVTRDRYISPEEILNEIKRFLNEETFPIDYISLSGSGEPTLNSGIREVIEGIKRITKIPVAVITNSSLIYLDEVKKDVFNADLVLPSLDAVSLNIFNKINRPNKELSLNKIIEGLIEFRKIYKGIIWLEILFCKGINDRENEISNMIEVVEKINPDKIHLNTVIRPPTEKWAKPVSHDEMEKIRALFGSKASIISEFDRHHLDIIETNIEKEILRILERRPLSLVDISKLIGISLELLKKIIDPLIYNGKIEESNFGGSLFYEIKRK